MFMQQDKTDEAFEGFINSFGIEKIKFRGNTAYKFETDDLPLLLSSLTGCHEKLFRLILTIHISPLIDNDERKLAIEGLRKFADLYLDRATSELIEALNNGQAVSKSFGIVK